MYFHIAANGTYTGSVLLGIIACGIFHAVDKCRAMAVKSHNVGIMSRELVGDKHLTPTGLVEYRHFGSISESGFLIDENDIDILNEGVVAYGVVGNVVMHILNEAIISYRDVVQTHITHTRRLFHSSGHSETATNRTDFYYTGKCHIVHKVVIEAVGNKHIIPIIGSAMLIQQRFNFIVTQVSVFHDYNNKITTK